MEGSPLRSVLEPCLLLLLRERPDHGYNLQARLAALGLVNGDSGRVYRALRSLEQEALVRSEWTRSGHGPARRTYHVTLEGCAMLGTWAHMAEDTRDLLDAYLSRWAHLQNGHGAGRPAGPAGTEATEATEELR